MKFRRRQIETYCTYITYQLTLFLAVIFLLGMTDDFFNWDIIPYKVQRMIERLVLPALGIILGGCAGLSLLLNFSLLSSSIELIATKNESENDGKFQLIIFGKKLFKVVLIVVIGLATLIFGLNTYDSYRANKLFSEFKMDAADSARINQLNTYLNQLNRSEDFIFKEENCESILADDTCLGYSNIQNLASIKKVLSNMYKNNLSYEIYTSFKGQLISITSGGVYINGIFVGYDEVMQNLDNDELKIEKEIINGLTVYSNKSQVKSRKAVIDLKENAQGKLYVTRSEE